MNNVYSILNEADHSDSTLLRVSLQAKSGRHERRHIRRIRQMARGQYRKGIEISVVKPPVGGIQNVKRLLLAGRISNDSKCQKRAARLSEKGRLFTRAQ